MKRLLFFLVFFGFLSFYPLTNRQKNVNIIWDEKELTYVIESIKRENLKEKHQKKKELPKIREHVIITAYTPSVWETDSTPFITASGKRVSESYVAVSRDLLPKLPFGKKVKIFIPDKNLTGCGKEVIGKSWVVRYVEDTMNKRHHKKIDLFFFSREKAIKFGKCKGIIIAE
jgi:3D (Asp-Asp-Asp) domain-containing protein